MAKTSKNVDLATNSNDLDNGNYYLGVNYQMENNTPFIRADVYSFEESEETTDPTSEVESSTFDTEKNSENGFESDESTLNCYSFWRETFDFAVPYCCRAQPQQHYYESDDDPPYTFQLERRYMILERRNYNLQKRHKKKKEKLPVTLL